MADSDNTAIQPTIEAASCRFVMPAVFTVSQAVSFKQSFQDVCQNNPDLTQAILNFHNTHFMDSSGLGALVSANKLARQRKINLVLQNVPEQVLMVLKLADLHRLFTIEKSTEPVPEKATDSAQSENGLTIATTTTHEAILSTSREPAKISSKRSKSKSIAPQPFITHPSVRSVPKRVIDIVGSIVGLGIVGVLFVPIAVAIKLDSKGPIFFGQTRCSRMGRRFKMWKFRSMVQDAEAKRHLIENEASGAIFKSASDPRITKVGKFLRKTSLDEIPQFWNVLKGEMSLVGTRPPTPDEVEIYEIPQWQRLDVKPGMTGEWQVNGRSSIKEFEDIVRLDLKYQENWSLMYDLQLILKTVLVLFNKKSGAM
ncbi:MAG: sugar transferase [Cyanobacteria bacterium J06638_22]